MKIIRANGVELTPNLVEGTPLMIQGAERDTLSFIFPGDADLSELDAAFSTEACETIYIEDGGNTYIHKGYTIRAKMEKTSLQVSNGTSESDDVYEDRIIISMSQRTYIESQLASLTETVDVLVMESLLG